jgi:hypothetical protein
VIACSRSTEEDIVAKSEVDHSRVKKISFNQPREVIMSTPEKEKKGIRSPLAFFTGIGLAIGCAAGVVTGNIPVGVGAGTAIGAALGVIMKKKKERGG